MAIVRSHHLLAVLGLVAAVLLASAGISASGAWFSSDVNWSQAYLAQLPGSPAVPSDCANIHFKNTIYGTEGDDVIYAGNGGSLVFGLGGNDTIYGGNGKDCLVGGDGNDTIYGENGPDYLFGGAGDDILIGSNGPEILDGGDGTDTCTGGHGPTTFRSCENTTDPSANAPVPAPNVPLTSAIPGTDAGATPTPAPTPTPTPTPTTTPTPTLDPTPTPTTPTPAAPNADFVGTVQADGVTVKWQDLSSGDITNWHWDFGDGATSDGQNPSHTYARYGDYPVTVTVSGPGGQDSRTKELHLRVAPTANFTGTIKPNGLTVKWQDLSTGYITRWHWDFGDGSTSNEQNPTHTYAAHGDYDVTLTVSWAGGGDSRTKALHLKVQT